MRLIIGGFVFGLGLIFQPYALQSPYAIVRIIIIFMILYGLNLMARCVVDRFDELEQKLKEDKEKK